MGGIWLRLKAWWLRLRHPDVEKVGAEAKVVMARANAIALTGGAGWIDSGHILEALLCEPEIVACLHSDLQPIEQALKDRGHSAVAPVDHAKKVLEAAILEARIAGIRVISPILLLAALFRMEDSIAHDVLAAHNVTLVRVRSAIGGAGRDEGTEKT